LPNGPVGSIPAIPTKFLKSASSKHKNFKTIIFEKKKHSEYIMDDELKQLVKEFFRILDIVEETDEGREFRPTNIYSSRALDGAKLNTVLSKMKEIVKD